MLPAFSSLVRRKRAFGNTDLSVPTLRADPLLPSRGQSFGYEDDSGLLFDRLLNDTELTVGEDDDKYITYLPAIEMNDDDDEEEGSSESKLKATDSIRVLDISISFTAATAPAPDDPGPEDSPSDDSTSSTPIRLSTNPLGLRPCTSLTKSAKDPLSIAVHDPTTQCAYRKGKCSRLRTVKKNGALHTLCAFHREKSCVNQKAFDGKKRNRPENEKEDEEANSEKKMKKKDKKELLPKIAAQLSKSKAASGNNKKKNNRIDSNVTKRTTRRKPAEQQRKRAPRGQSTHTRSAAVSEDSQSIESLAASVPASAPPERNGPQQRKQEAEQADRDFFEAFTLVLDGKQLSRAKKAAITQFLHDTLSFEGEQAQDRSTFSSPSAAAACVRLLLLQMFLEALALDLQKTQRAIASSCLFCVPQARSLVADQELTADDLYNHFLTPAGTATDAHARHPGEYDTLNGKTVSIQGSHIHTGRGFDEKRKVRILLSEQKEVHHQEVTVLHLSRPLSGGIALPEDPNELDVATFRRFTAILRSFPENELVFYQLDETIAQVKKICTHNQFFNRYEQTLPSLLQEEWEIAVDEILQAGSFEDDSDEGDGERHHQSQSQHSSHLLQIQQVVECYLMEQLHDFIFPRVVVSCRAQEQTLSQVLYRMRHYSPDDFGIRKEFQDAVATLVGVKDRKTPLDMLLAFKSCIDGINDAITRNLKQRNLDLGRYQMTTDDILDQLLFVLVQAFNHTVLVGSSSASGSDGKEKENSDEDDRSTTPRRQSLSSSSRDLDGAEDKGADESSDSQNAAASRFPIAAVLRYISDYHFTNSNTTALGFTIANFQVAIEYFLMRAAHIETCRVCIQSLQMERSGGGGDSSEAMALSTCSQGILLSKCEAAYERNVRSLHTVSSELNDDHLRSTARDDDSDRGEDKDGGGRFKQLFIVGDWSSASSSSEKEESGDDDDEEYVNVTPDDHFQAHGGQFLSAEADTAVRANRVATSALTETSSNGTTATITQISAGQRFFAAVNDQGQLFTWGDRSGGRLGYTSAAGDARRQQIPRRVVAGVFEKCHVINVACGAFHTLATDVNGHVFAWGSNARGQLGFLTHATISESSASTASTTVVAAPTLVSDLRGTYVSSVACGEYHSLALSSDGRVFSWGCNKYSKLGRVIESFADAVQPKALDETWTGFALDLKTIHGGEETRNGDSVKRTKSNSVVRRIAAGKDHSLAISYDGAVFAWGRGDSGQLGHGSFMDVARPKQVMALSRSRTEALSGFFSVVDVAGGSDFSLFLVSTGAAFVSGRDPSSSSLSSQPTLFPELIQHHSSQQVIGISCGEAHFGLHLSNGTLFVSNSGGNESNSVDSERAEGDDLSNHHEVNLNQRQLELVGSINGHIKRVACGGSHTLVLS